MRSKPEEGNKERKNRYLFTEHPEIQTIVLADLTKETTGGQVSQKLGTLTLDLELGMRLEHRGQAKQPPGKVRAPLLPVL